MTLNYDYIEAFFLKNGQNELNIVTSDPIKPYQLYWTYELNPQTQNKHYLFAGNEKNCRFQFNYNPQQVNYFIIEWPDERPILFGYRILPLAGMFNFRDIGGYRTREGNHLKWGIGYRSDYLKNLKTEGIPFFKSLHLRSIIDYRSPHEITADPNPVIDSNIKSYQFDPEANTAQEAGKLQNMQASQSLKERAQAALKNGETGPQKMIQQQLDFVNNASSHRAFSQALKVLSEEHNLPSMQHCRGGKDRTGFALMLLEGILGVSREQLIYDYMLTNRARREKNQRYYAYFLKETQDQKTADYLYSLFDTRPEFIAASIDRILSDYDSFESYAEQALGLKKKEIGQLKQLFLNDDALKE